MTATGAGVLTTPAPASGILSTARGMRSTGAPPVLRIPRPEGRSRAAPPPCFALAHRCGMRLSAHATAVLFPIHRHSQQHIPRYATQESVAGTHEEHSTHHSRPRTVERSSLGGDPIRGGVVSRRIEIPDHFTFLCRVGAHVSIDGARKDHTRYSRHRGGLSGAAIETPAASRRRCRPTPLSGSKIERENASALLVVKLNDGARIRILFELEPEIRQRRVSSIVIGSRTPLNPANDAAVSKPLVPYGRSFVVWVEGVDHSRLLPRYQNVLAVRQRAQNCRRTEIQVRSVRLRTVGRDARRTSEVKRVLGRELMRPQHFALLKVQRHDRVAGLRGRI